MPRDNPGDTLPLTPDRALEATFPVLLDGQPLVDLASGRWIETVCSLGGEGSVDAALATVPAGFTLTDLRVASAQAQVDGLAVEITAFRLPGHSGSELLPVVGALSSAVSPGRPKFASFDPVTLGGKNVSHWSDSLTGAVSYLYAHDDILFIIDNVTLSQANKVLAALP